jgi:hypothetical protein
MGVAAEVEEWTVDGVGALVGGGSERGDIIGLQ